MHIYEFLDRRLYDYDIRLRYTITIAFTINNFRITLTYV